MIVSVNLDDFSMRVGTIIANLDVVFRDITEIRSTANFALSQNAETTLRIAVLENQQKAVQEIKMHLSTLVPLSNIKLDLIEQNFSSIQQIISKIEGEVLVIKTSIEGIKTSLGTEFGQFKTSVEEFKVKNAALTTTLNDASLRLITASGLIAEVKLMLETELRSHPTMRSMLLELVHRYPSGDKWAWTDQIRYSVEYGFWTKIGEIILVLLVFAAWKVGEYYFASKQTPSSEVIALKEADVKIQKAQEEMKKNQESIQKNQDDILYLLRKKSK